jgi:large subunit ribosomal protein L3
MAEQVEETKTAETTGAKKAPATFRTILGEKVGMTQIYHPKDKGLYDVTIVKAGPCSVLRVKTADSKDGYNAVQLAYGEKKEKNVSKAQLGQFKKAGVAPARWVKEIRVADTKGLEAGQLVTVDVPFKAGDYVDVQGTSKGHGFAGVMKRHNFLGMPASHGASDKERSPGSLASRRSLGRVLPGQRMAGHMGAETVTMQKLEIVQVDAEKNLIFVNGSVPGPKGGFVVVHETVKSKKVRTEVKLPTVRKDKMGNIIKPAAPKGGAKK